MDEATDLLETVCNAFEAIYCLELDEDTSQEFSRFLDEYYRSMKDERAWENN